MAMSQVVEGQLVETRAFTRRVQCCSAILDSLNMVEDITGTLQVQPALRFLLSGDLLMKFAGQVNSQVISLYPTTIWLSTLLFQYDDVVG